MKESIVQETPRRKSSKRLSFDVEREEMDAPSPKSPQTPSPPNSKIRRSSVSHGFLPSPLPGSNHKRDSGGNSAAPDSPGVKTRLLPPTTPRTRNSEHFLSPSPKLKSPGVYKESEKPIREISNNLKTRLSYAFVKLQNGWVDKTLPELESQTSSPEGEDAVPKQRASYSNQFLIGDDAESNSAHAAFLNALTSPKKKQRQESSSSANWSASPRKPPTLPKITTKPKDGPSEVEAIETLMSLSSPTNKHSRKKSTDFTLPPPPPLAHKQTEQNEQPILAFSSRSSSNSSLPNTLAKPFLLKNEGDDANQALVDIETDVEETNTD